MQLLGSRIAAPRGAAEKHRRPAARGKAGRGEKKDAIDQQNPGPKRGPLLAAFKANPLPRTEAQGNEFGFI